MRVLNALGLGLCGVLFFAQIGMAANTRVTNPNALSVEIGGRALLYSLSFDRVLSERLLAGIGVGSVPLNFSSGLTSGTSATIIPVYANYYFSDDEGSLFFTVGANLVTNATGAAGLVSSPGGLPFNTSPIQATVGLGYEYRSDPGFLLRVAAYGIYGDSFKPWGGITFGYSF